jgi:ammonium transporter, Amt family
MMPPHSTVLCMVGTGMLWVGWYGFNAGSALGADSIAANAFMTTTLATAVGSFTWAASSSSQEARVGPRLLLGRGGGARRHHAGDRLRRRHRRGDHRPLAGAIPFLFCVKLKAVFGYDDALDTFGVHAVGGTIGALLTGLLATAAVNPNLTAATPGQGQRLAALVAHGGLWHEQLSPWG